MRRRRWKILRIWIVLIVVGGLALVIFQNLGKYLLSDYFTKHDSARAIEVQVTYVHDGDTFRIGNERVRILGIDAPEIGDRARCAKENRMAIEARNYLRSEIGRHGVRIERNGHDIYGRTLAYVYIDGQDIAETMIRNKLAKPYIAGHHIDWCN